jgi:SAM-dependent methyltransferase
MNDNQHHPRDAWDEYWGKVSLISFFANFYRKNFLSRPMSKIIERYFPENGVFLEAGCGSATDTFYYQKKSRRFIAMDISEAALQLAVRQKNIDEVKLGDICSITFPDNYFDGIWNLGVMEHFSNPEMGKAFSEMRRVLKPGAHVILLWPSVWNLVNTFFWWLFPKMPSLLHSRRQGTEILEQNNFQPCDSSTTIMGDIILVGRKI